jgi:hypothetical protein
MAMVTEQQKRIAIALDRIADSLQTEEKPVKKGKKYTITHKGKTLNTNHWYPLTDAECLALKKAYYTKPSSELVVRNLKKIANGGTQVAHITNYFVKDLMAKVKLLSPRWSIEEIFESNDLIRYFWSRVLSSEKVYPPHKTDINNFETALRLSGGGVAMKPSNFPMKSIDQILEQYNVNGKYYDFSCGWGVRMLSAMKNNVEYFGTDPNHLLVGRLNSLHESYNNVNDTKNKVNIKCSGSEVFHAEWENTIGVAFSSPPYFSLEDYKIGNQSYTEGTTYEQWLEGYLTRTIQNIHKYLVSDGYFLINVKNFSEYKLVQDTQRIAKANGFDRIDSILLKNTTRPSAKDDLNTNEIVMVFKKTINSN